MTQSYGEQVAAAEVEAARLLVSNSILHLHDVLGWRTPKEVEEAIGRATGPLQVEVQVLRGHIANIDAHTHVGYGQPDKNPDDTGRYLIDAPALHRALGAIDQESLSCKAEQDLQALRDKLEVLGPLLLLLQTWRKTLKEVSNPNYLQDLNHAVANLAAAVDGFGSFATFTE